MKQILVPTDFSDISGVAFRYAQALAMEKGADILLLHVYHPSFDTGNPFFGFPSIELERLKQQSMDLFYEEHLVRGKAKSPVIDREISVGVPGEELAAYSREAGMIVMGSRGRSNIIYDLFGSVATHVMQHAACPVILIPEKGCYEGYREVVFASDYQAGEEAILEWIVDLSEEGMISIHFLHVVEKGEEGQVENLAIKETAQRIDMKFVTVTSDDVADGILKYGKAQQADLIVMGSRKRSFVDRLFRRSQTKKMAFETEIPLLVFPLRR